ncbi:MAG TPA: ABC transporter ATP-binding protein [Candidatus Saccharimonadales bacterium]|jgi:putative ABC transport system ATP-binding protein|nr:ABC transporter ATP-binding protein [Candidatus Saccharimonadales bacterium]
MIEVKNLRKVYGKKDSTFEALKGVTFVIPDGATVAIIGKSGSGKSTLMHIIGGLDRPTEGEVIIDGKNIGTMKRKQIDHFRAHDLGFVFQSFFVEGNQTCYQNVALPLEIVQTGLRSRKALVESALERVELTDKMKNKARNLSGGQKQRLAIARAIVNRPKLLMADEPTGNLDSETGDKIIDLLFGLNKKEGSTLVVVTHDPDLAARCDIQISIKDGVIVEIAHKNGAKGTIKKGVRA